MNFVGFNIFLYFLFNHMIKIDAHRIERKPKNRYLFETIISRKQTESNNVVHFSSNPI